MTPAFRQREANKKSADAAKLLNQLGMPVRVLRDDRTVTTTTVTALPWQLGHGAWVVKVEGIAGGYDCVRVVPV